MHNSSLEGNTDRSWWVSRKWCICGKYRDNSWQDKRIAIICSKRVGKWFPGTLFWNNISVIAKVFYLLKALNGWEFSFWTCHWFLWGFNLYFVFTTACFSRASKQYDQIMHTLKAGIDGKLSTRVSYFGQVVWGKDYAIYPLKIKCYFIERTLGDHLTKCNT